VAKAFVGSNPTPRTTIADDSCFGVFPLSRRGGLVHASFSCWWLVSGWPEFVSRLFFCSGFGLWVSGVVEKPGKALENWLGGHVSESGLILGDFSLILSVNPSGLVP